jgi:HrpA-like RNA helicase
VVSILKNLCQSVAQRSTMKEEAMEPSALPLQWAGDRVKAQYWPHWWLRINSSCKVLAETAAEQIAQCRWQAQRAALPVAAIRAPLLEALQQADVAVVSGDTGCGKTTQARMLQNRMLTWP